MLNSEKLLSGVNFAHKDILLSYVSWAKLHINSYDKDPKADVYMERYSCVDGFVAAILPWVQKGYKISILDRLNNAGLSNDIFFVYRIEGISDEWRLRVLQEALDV